MEIDLTSTADTYCTKQNEATSKTKDKVEVDFEKLAKERRKALKINL